MAGVITVNYKKRNLLPPPNELGFKYDLPDEEPNGAEVKYIRVILIALNLLICGLYRC